MGRDVLAPDRQECLGASEKPQDGEHAGEIDKLRFVLAMLKHLQLVKADDIDLLLQRFDAIDADKSGNISLYELNSYKREVAEQAAKAQIQGTLHMAQLPRVPAPAVGAAIVEVEPSEAQVQGKGKL